MINYTFIIPHRNIPSLLERCLHSIPDRNDIQIIVIDDNSDSHLKELNNLIIKTQHKVTYIKTTNNNGGGYARNIGLQKAIGKWIIFADADDYFNYCLNDILNQYINSQADIIYFKGNSVDTNTYVATNRTNHLNKWIDMFHKSPYKSELSLRYYFGEPWCKIIRRKIIITHHIKFDETPIHNDTTFSYLIGFHANKIDIDIRALYCVTTRENSVSKSIDNDKEIIRIDVFSRAERFFRQNHIPVNIGWHYYQCICFLMRGNIRYFQKSVSLIKKNSPFTMKSYLLIIKEFIRYIIKPYK